MSAAPPGPSCRGLLTLAVGGLGGGVFFALDLPLPWVLGSMAASALCTRAAPFVPGLPKPWRGYAMAAIGTMLGTGFTSEIVAEAGHWLPSVLAMTILSAAMFQFSYAALRRWTDMSPATALFAAAPGGLSVVSALAEDHDVEVERVVLCHTARLIVLLVTAPIALRLLAGIDLSAANAASYATAEKIDPLRHGTLLLVAVASWWAGRRIGFPSAMLLVPLLAAAALHATGLLGVHVPPALSSLAQVAIGAGVGARFAGRTAAGAVRDGWLAAAIASVLAGVSALAAFGMARLTNFDIASLFLAYLPGGAPEIGVVALALSIAPAFVATHHVVRVLLIVVALPVAARRLS